MNALEERILHSFQASIQEQVDPLRITHKLYKQKLLGQSQKKVIISLPRNNRREAWEVLSNIIVKTCRLQQVLQLLLECGYVELFLRISVQWQCLVKATSKDVVVVQRTGSIDTSRRFSQDLFIELKIKTHNIQFTNPRKAIHEKTQMYKYQYLHECDHTEKTILADKYASSLCAEIDAHTMLYVTKLPTHGLFYELEQLIPHTSNTHVTQVAYDSRLAIAHAIADQDDKGEDFLQRAMVSSVYIGHCVELVNMLYIYVFNLICLYEKNPNKRTLDKIMNVAEFSLHCLQEEEEATIRYFWMRMFYLRMAYCLLGISNKGDIIPDCLVFPRHVKQAQALLVEVDKIWSGIESRRQMFYYVAQARIAELENSKEEIDLAIDYIDMAIEIGSKGSFGETQFISSYAKLLNDRQLRYTMEESNHSDQTSGDENGRLPIGHQTSGNRLDRAGIEHGEEKESLILNTAIKTSRVEPNEIQTYLKLSQIDEMKPLVSVQCSEEAHFTDRNPSLKNHEVGKTATTQKDINVSPLETNEYQNIKESGLEIDIFKNNFESLFLSNDSSIGGEHYLTLLHINRPDRD